MLALLSELSAHGLLEHASDGGGLLSRRRLVAEYERVTAGRENVTAARGSGTDLQR